MKREYRSEIKKSWSLFEQWHNDQGTPLLQAAEVQQPDQQKKLVIEAPSAELSGIESRDLCDL